MTHSERRRAAFQAAMPVIGWLLASSFSEFVAPVDHWIAFGLLSLLGVNMIREAVSASENDSRDSGDVGFHRLCLLGLATSIDALAVGVSLAMVDTSLPQAVLVIALATLALSAAGVLIGHRAGLRFRKPAEIAGGLVLIAIGFKVLLDHLGAF
ncbi:manganese efflux pump MntP [Corynebacterium variabile]|uniref:manganese efflux pump MntP n=1 Tax=Corynebacterium variabile TaxID=1727 RepID=UPI003FD356CB